jgi:hypothetical protein
VVVAMSAIPLGRLPVGVDAVMVPADSLADPPGDRPDAAPRAPFPVAVEVAASVGRTTAEASARADRDPRLRGARDPRRRGLFGTLEECQARVVELAHAGVTELRCWVPDTPDLPDVIAQLSAAPVGTLTPSRRGDGARPPQAPAGWGGRPRHAR